MTLEFSSTVGGPSTRIDPNHPLPVYVTENSGSITITDASGTITLGGTAQTAVAANPARRYLLVSNPDTSTDLFVNWTGTATTGAGSVRLTPGAGVVFDVQVPPGAVSVLSATTGKAFTVQVG